MRPSLVIMAILLAAPPLFAGGPDRDTVMILATGHPADIAAVVKAATQCGFANVLTSGTGQLLARVSDVNDTKSTMARCLQGWAVTQPKGRIHWAPIFLSEEPIVANAQFEQLPKDFSGTLQRTDVRLHLEFDGNTRKACQVIGSSGNASVDRESCRLVGRFPIDHIATPRFPDPDGTTLVVRWPAGNRPAQSRTSFGGATPINMASWIRTADMATTPNLRGEIDAAFGIDNSGHIEHCVATSLRHDQKAEMATCKLLEDRASFLPKIDADGLAVPAMGKMHIVWGG